MIVVGSLAELAARVGEDLGTSGWKTIDQPMIDAFAELTGDRNWYHCDRERAARELPGGLPIAHGLLTLSLVPGMAGEIVQVTHHGRAFNYGLNKVRFPAPVPAGSRVRLRMSVVSAAPQAAGTLLCRGYTMELAGSPKPAMVAEMMTLIVAA